MRVVLDGVLQTLVTEFGGSVNVVRAIETEFLRELSELLQGSVWMESVDDVQKLPQRKVLR